MRQLTIEQMEDLRRILGVDVPRNFRLDIEVYDLDRTQHGDMPLSHLTIALEDGKLVRQIDDLQSMGLVYW